MTFPFGRPSPAFRNPVPIFEGGVTRTLPAAPTTQQILDFYAPIPLERPQVGTAWSLGGFTLSVRSTGMGTSTSTFRFFLGMSANYGGVADELDRFDFSGSGVAGVEIDDSIYHAYPSEVTIFDTHNYGLAFKSITPLSNTSPPVTLAIRWRGNVAYIN